VEDLDLFHEQAVGLPLLMRIWVEFTTNDYIGAPQPDVHFEGQGRFTIRTPDRQTVTPSINLNYILM